MKMPPESRWWHTAAGLGSSSVMLTANAPKSSPPSGILAHLCHRVWRLGREVNILYQPKSPSTHYLSLNVSMKIHLRTECNKRQVYSFNWCMSRWPQLRPHLAEGFWCIFVLRNSSWTSSKNFFNHKLHSLILSTSKYIMAESFAI